MRIILIFIVALLIFDCEARGGRGGGGRGGRGGRGMRKITYRTGKGESFTDMIYNFFVGLFGGTPRGKAKISTKAKSTSSNTYSYPRTKDDMLVARQLEKPSSPYLSTLDKPFDHYFPKSPNYDLKPIGWNIPASSNVNQKPIGWNIQGSNNAQKLPSYSSIQKPAGPPPAYPGLEHKPIINRFSPPAYSPSLVNPPAYSPNIILQRSYTNANLGSVGNSHRSLFKSDTRKYRGGYRNYGNSAGASSGGSWGYDEEKKWRHTTKAPYFQNRIPGGMMSLPAAAVLGAATAFGVYSLLPLSVPFGRPLLSCNTTTINQIDLMLNDNIYSCVNESVILACPLTTDEKVYLSLSTENSSEISSEPIPQCNEEPLICSDLKDFSNGKLNCRNNTLISHVRIFCNSTFTRNTTGVYGNETRTVLQCYQGILPRSKMVFVPTKLPTVNDTNENSVTQKTPEFWEIPYLSANKSESEYELQDEYITLNLSIIF